MPSRATKLGDIGTAKAASDSYDVENIFLSDEGWVYRHYKTDDKLKFWDEIIVAGEVDSTLVINTVPNAPIDEVSAPGPGFETVAGGVDVIDGKQDVEYSPSWTGSSAPPAPPISEPAVLLGDVSITGAAAADTGVESDPITANITGDVSATWSWTSSPAGVTFSAPNANVTTATSSTVGTFTLTATATNASAENSPKTAQSQFAVADEIVGYGSSSDVTLNLTGAYGNTAYTVSSGATNPSVVITKGQTLTINNTTGAHPVAIVSDSSGTAVTDGNPTQNGTTTTWDTTSVTAGVYYYQCTSHSAMIGQITVSAAA